ARVPLANHAVLLLASLLPLQSVASLVCCSLASAVCCFAASRVRRFALRHPRPRAAVALPQRSGAVLRRIRGNVSLRAARSSSNWSAHAPYPWIACGSGVSLADRLRAERDGVAECPKPASSAG